MKHKRIKLALVSSILIHAVFVAGIAAWSLRYGVGLGGGEGIVEVGFVDGEDGGSSRTSLRAERSNPMMSKEIASVPSEPLNDFVDGQGGGGGGSGGGEGGGTKFGAGDPRLTQIWKKINHAKYYPEMARRQGIEGAPKVAFSILEDGEVSQVKIVESSGNDILDNAAMEAIQNSTPLPFYPQPITIAVRYSLKDR